MKKSAFLSILCLSLLVACSKSDRDLTTTFEKSNYLETDSYDGTIAYAKLLDKQFKEVHYQSIGQTAQGRDVPLLIVDKNGYKILTTFHPAFALRNEHMKIPLYEDVGKVKALLEEMGLVEITGNTLS